MKTLRISAAALAIGFTGYAGAALAQQTTPPPAQTMTTDTPAQLPEADSATTSASPTSATVSDGKLATDPEASAKTKAKKHKRPTEQPSPDAPKPN